MFSKMTKKEKWIWLAALLEGEGTFTTSNSGESLRISLGMTGECGTIGDVYTRAPFAAHAASSGIARGMAT
jgi:hypothetical protein